MPVVRPGARIKPATHSEVCVQGWESPKWIKMLLKHSKTKGLIKHLYKHTKHVETFSPVLLF